MDGKDVPPNLRLPLIDIAPGHVATRSAKLVNRIAVSEEESTIQWHGRDHWSLGLNNSKTSKCKIAPETQNVLAQGAVTQKYREKRDRKTQDVVVEACFPRAKSAKLSACMLVLMMVVPGIRSGDFK